MNTITLRIAFTIIACSLALQSYQCSSPDFTTGKSKFNNRDFVGANEYLTKETQKNPGNAEAWIILARTRKALNPPDFQGAADALVEAQKNAANPKIIEEAGREAYYLWVDLYNTGINEYNEFFKSSQRGSPEKISSVMDLAAKLRPENAEVFTLCGAVYLEKGDTARAIDYLTKYVEASKTNYNFAVAHNLTVKINRDEAIAALGKPLASKGQKYGRDSVITDKYMFDNKDAYIFSVARSNQGFTTDGWRYDAPQGRSESEKERYSPFDVRPYLQLAAIYHNRRDYDAALKYIDLASAIDPSDEQISGLRLSIYEAQGKTANVLKSYEKLLQTDPNNISNLVNYGSILNRMGQYEQAIEQFDKVLKLAPNNDNALFNIAAAYKNKASEIQKSEKQKSESNPKYKEIEDSYFPILRKSAEYFEKFKDIPAHRSEFAALQQLANIYEVVREKSKLKIIMAELEAVEYANETNPAYYNLMGSLYAKQNQLDKSKKYFDKETELLKK